MPNIRTRVTNADARRLVEKCREFVTGNQTIFGNNYGSEDDKWYVVYSYGKHFPMYVCDRATGRWYGNEEKFSRTTSKHQSITRPSGVDIQWMSVTALCALAVIGPTEFVKRQFIHAATGGK